MMTNVVITGAGGFMGRALVERLVGEGVEVIAVGRREASRRGRMGPLSRPTPSVIGSGQWSQPTASRRAPEATFPCRYEMADIREPGSLESFLSSESVVFHLAGHTSVSGSVREPQLDFECNTIGFLEVLQSVRDARASLVFPSSPAVFEPGQKLPLSEDARKRPTSPYGAAKLACEGYAQSFHACYDVDVKIARVFNVYGPGMTKFAICDFYRKLKQNPSHLEILGDGDQIRDYLYIDDLVEGLLTIAASGSPGEDYNLAFGQPVRTIDLARMVARAMGNDAVEISARGESFPGDIAKWYADISKVRDLGFEPRIALADGLAKTISWFDHTMSAEIPTTAEKLDNWEPDGTGLQIPGA